MVKVAFFAEILIDDFDGASRTMFQLIHRIDKNKFRYLFFCGIPPLAHDDNEFIKIPVVRAPFNARYTMAIPQLAFGRITKELQSFSPNVIHIATPSILGEWALKYALKNNIPVISIYHTHFISYFQFYLKNFPWLIKPVENMVRHRMIQFYNRCELTYVPSKTMIDELSSYGITNQKLKLWQRGLENNTFTPDKKNLRFRESYNINRNKKPLVLYASRVVWEKNVQTLMDLYKSTHEKYQFVVAGDGSAKEAAEKAMPEANFLGNLDHHILAEVYASCDIFVFPSTTETYGNVVVEAMASGLPCVIANGGGSASFIDNGVNGFLVPATDLLAYERSIDSILNNPETRANFIEKGLQFTSNLKWNKLAEIYFDDVTYLAYKS